MTDAAAANPQTGHLVDWEATRQNLPGNESVVRELAGMLLDEAPRQLRKLHRSLQASDADTFERSAHSLKGSAGIFGIGPITALAQKLESLDQNGMLADAPALLDELDGLVDQLTDELTAFLRDAPPRDKKDTGTGDR